MDFVFPMKIVEINQCYLHKTSESPENRVGKCRNLPVHVLIFIYSEFKVKHIDPRKLICPKSPDRYLYPRVPRNVRCISDICCFARKYCTHTYVCVCNAVCNQPWVSSSFPVVFVEFTSTEFTHRQGDWFSAVFSNIVQLPNRHATFEWSYCLFCLKFPKISSAMSFE